jgi:hypothetical protein
MRSVSVARVIRVGGLDEGEKFDREDLEATTPEQRFNAVEELRRTWFGKAGTQRRLARVLTRADLDGNAIPFDRGSRRR